ncbi:MAG: AmmeMemoRadiSam system protein B [Planctomycetota bacterium]|nr:AmmeMemoRadiSam system protein B [Planctomycetota bacterium]
MSETTIPDHLLRPHVRPFQTVPVPHKESGQMLAGLRNPSGISAALVGIHPQMLPLVTMFQGERTVEEIAAVTKAPLEVLTNLVSQLDEAGLMWGPTMERLERETMAKVSAAGAMPVGAAAAFGATQDEARATMQGLLSSADDPELGASVIGLVAPHLDRTRGGDNYAAAYKAFEGLAAPDRVVILGTNHFGLGDGVTMTRHGFDTPLGRVEPDQGVLAALDATFGDRLFKDEIDLVAEHSIQLHTVWVKHLFPSARVVAALLPDPNRAMIDDSGARVATREFVEGLRAAIASAAGTNYVVASADLSHVGVPFGDQAGVDEERAGQVEAHDRAMLSTFCDQAPDEFLAEMAENRNPTRWCSVGTMWAARAAMGCRAELLQYRASIDEQRTTLVSSAAVALLTS